MSNQKPLVSICIPTYNRYQQLQQVINAIVVQPEFLNGKVEIVISDNTSEDDTEKIGREYAEKYPNIRYFRNKENIRDRNFPLALSRGNGKLRKLNNDTMLLKEDALKQLCFLAETYQESKPVIFLDNGQLGEETISEMNFQGFVAAESYKVTWIACFTIWEDDCENLENDTEACELLLWQVRKLYELACKKDQIIVYSKELGTTLYTPKKNISYGLYKVFYCNYMQLLRRYESVLDNKTIEHAERVLLYDFFTPWIIDWEMGTSDMKYSKEENLKEAVFTQYADKPYWKEYLKYYKQKYWKQKIKRIVKKILGRK